MHIMNEYGMPAKGKWCLIWIRALVFTPSPISWNVSYHPCRMYHVHPRSFQNPLTTSMINDRKNNWASKERDRGREMTGKPERGWGPKDLYQDMRGIVQSSVCLFFIYLSLVLSFSHLPQAFFFLCGLQEKSLIRRAEHKVQPRPEGHRSILHLLGEIYFPSPYQTHQMSGRKGTGFGGKLHTWRLISKTYERSLEGMAHYESNRVHKVGT